MDTARGLAGLRVAMFLHWQQEETGYASPALVGLDRLLTSRFTQEGGTLAHFFVAADDDRQVGEVLFQVDEARFHALLVSREILQYRPRLLAVLQQLGIPLIGYFGTACGHVRHDTVRIDDAWAFRRAADYLAELGHRRMAFIGLPVTQPDWESWVSVRLAAFRDELSRKGLALPVDAQFGLGELERPAALRAKLRPPEPLGADQPGHGYAIGLRFPADRFSAVACCNDPVASGFIVAMRERGFRVPQDVSVIGYDNHPHNMVQRELTTFALPGQSMADAVVALIQNRVAGAAYVGDQVNILLHPVLVPRETCAAWCP